MNTWIFWTLLGVDVRDFWGKPIWAICSARGTAHKPPATEPENHNLHIPGALNRHPTICTCDVRDHATSSNWIDNHPHDHTNTTETWWENHNLDIPEGSEQTSHNLHLGCKGPCDLIKLNRQSHPRSHERHRNRMGPEITLFQWPTIHREQILMY